MSDNIYNENIKLLKQHIYLNEEKIKNNFNELYKYKNVVFVIIL